MNLAKRKVQIAQISCQINGQVMAQVARNLTDSEDGFLNGMEYFVCDNDTLFTQEFEDLLESSGVDLIRTRVATPEQNGYAERFVKSPKEECLDRMIFFGERSLRKAVNEYVEHYHHERLNTQVTLFLVTLAGWMNRKQQTVIDYLLEEKALMIEM